MKKEKKSVVMIALVTAICLLGDSMLYIVLPIFWKDFGLEHIWQVGILLAINRFVRLPINPLVGYLYHRIPYKHGLYVACLLTAVTTISYGFIKEFWLLLVARALWGVAWSILRLGGYLTVIDASTDKNRGELMGTYNGLWGLGSLAGMLTGGFLINYLSIEIICSSFSIMALLTLPIIYFSTITSVQRGTFKDKQTQKLPTLSFLREKQLLIVIVMGFIMAISIFGMFSSYLSKMIEAHYVELFKIVNITVGVTALAGILQAIQWSCNPLVAPWIGKLTDTKYDKHIILIASSSLFAIIFLILMLDLPIFIWITSVLLIQFLNTIIVTLVDTIASGVSNQISKVKVMTFYTIIIDIGAAIGPVIVFSALGWFSVISVHIMLACLFLILAAFTLYSYCITNMKQIESKNTGL